MFVGNQASKPSPGTILASEPFRPVVLRHDGAFVKFYKVTVLSRQDYADAELSYNERSSPEYLFERGFIVKQGREVLGFRNLEDMTFHTLNTVPTHRTQSLDLLNILTEVETAGFDFQEYYSGEQEILKPALEARGFADVSFYDIERDSFGPLIRGVRATDPDGWKVEFFYG